MSRFDRGTDAKVEEARTRASSGPRRAVSIRRLVAGSTRRKVAFLSISLLLGAAGVAVAGPSGEWLEGGQQATAGVVKFGPINPVNKFPDWYRDSNAVEVEPCLSNFDPMCNAPTPAPDPDSEVSFPDNFPDEFFYFTGEASLTANGGNDVLALYTIEGTYGGGNTQTVFGRTRYRVRGGLTPGEKYTVTNPYGVDTLVAGDDGTIFVTDDVGVGSGNFGGLFEGQVGPFLQWDTDKPAHYLGDPATPHTVTGSPFNQNFVKIEGDNIGGAGNPNPCPDAPNASRDCIYTNLFSILGKESTRGGVEVARATYSLADTAGAKPQIDVMAESKGTQDIVVQDTIVGAGRRFQVTPLEFEKERYFARVNVQGTRPPTVNVINRSDTPQSVKEVPVFDHVTGTAVYNADTDNLRVTAASSDKTMPLTDFHVTGVGASAATNASGVADIHTIAPTSTVRITSGKGGHVDVPVVVEGNGLAALPLAANAGADQTVEQGVTVELDGTASTGNIDSYKWTSSDPSITLTGANSPKATFTAPGAAGDYTFTLEVTGPDGPNGATTTKSASVVVHVNEVTNARARIAFGGNVVATNLAAGTLTVPQNLPLTLDAGQSAGAATFTWSQVAGPTVDLGATNQAKITFTFPKTGTPIKLQVQARQPGAPSGSCVADACTTATITLNPERDDLQITTARFVTASSRWRVDGTASSTNRNRVQVYSGLALDPARRIGTADVLADGTWSVDARDSVIPLTSCQCVTIVSDRGGQVVDFKLEKLDTLPLNGPDPGTPPPPIVTAAAARADGPTALAAVPLAGATTFRVAPFAAPATVTAASVGTTGVPVTLSVPTGANLVRVRVLTTANKALFSTFKKVKGGTKVKMNIKSAKLRKQLRAGKRYVIEVRAGTARNHLGKATRKVVRIRA